MSEAVPTLHQYASMAWCSVGGGAQGQLFSFFNALVIFLCYVCSSVHDTARTVFDRSNTGIADSNPDRGMDVCPRFSVLRCPV
jgi:hypothetical protein